MTRQPRRRKSEPATPSERARGSVTLWGEELARDGTHIQFAVRPIGDAVDLNVSGIHWFAKRQIAGEGHVDGLDYIRISYALAVAKAAQNPF